MSQSIAQERKLLLSRKRLNLTSKGILQYRQSTTRWRHLNCHPLNMNTGASNVHTVTSTCDHKSAFTQEAGDPINNHKLPHRHDKLSRLLHDGCVAAGGDLLGTSTAGTQVHLPVLFPRERVSAEYRASGWGGEGTDGDEREKTHNRHKRKKVLEDEVTWETCQSRSQLQVTSPVKLKRAEGTR